MRHAAQVYRRRRLAAVAVLGALVLAVVLAFGAFGTQATVPIHGDQLGPDNDESREAYIDRAAQSLKTADEPAYALVSFQDSRAPADAAAAVARAQRMDAVVVGMGAPIATPEPIAGHDRADVIATVLQRLRDAYEGMGAVPVPTRVDAIVVWSSGDELREIAQNPSVAAVEAAPADAAWGSFGVRPLNSVDVGNGASAWQGETAE